MVVTSVIVSGLNYLKRKILILLAPVIELVKK
jgi:hypothetical protein